MSIENVPKMAAFTPGQPSPFTTSRSLSSEKKGSRSLPQVLPFLQLLLLLLLLLLLVLSLLLLLLLLLLPLLLPSSSSLPYLRSNLASSPSPLLPAPHRCPCPKLFPKPSPASIPAITFKWKRSGDQGRDRPPQ